MDFGAGSNVDDIAFLLTSAVWVSAYGSTIKTSTIFLGWLTLFSTHARLNPYLTYTDGQTININGFYKKYDRCYWRAANERHHSSQKFGPTQLGDDSTGSPRNGVVT